MRPPAKPHACMGIITHRSGILQTFKLQVSEFPTTEEAYKVADHFIAQQRADWPPGMMEKFPDRLCEGFPAADLFWFSDYKGMGTHTAPPCKGLIPCRS